MSTPGSILVSGNAGDRIHVSGPRELKADCREAMETSYKLNANGVVCKYLTILLTPRRQAARS